MKFKMQQLTQDVIHMYWAYYGLINENFLRDKDVPGKTMCQDDNYISYLQNAVNYRIKEGI